MPVPKHIKTAIEAQFECWDIEATSEAITQWAADPQFVYDLLERTGSEFDPAAHNPDETKAPSATWGRVELAKYLDGSYTPPCPAFLKRTDGVGLLYKGLTHSFHGESESGKSLVVQGESVCRLHSGERVLYIDHESDPASIAERLLILGATPEEIAERFVYVQPEVKPESSEVERAAFESLLSQTFDLVVIDGVTEAMVMLGGDSTDVNERFTAWSNSYPKMFTTRTGAAVVVIDHVTKNAESRGRFAIGAQAKMSSITGAAYSVDVVQPLGRGLKGALSVRVGKDRPGYVRPRSGEFRASDRTQEAAYVVVDSTGDSTTMTVWPPRSEDTDPVRKAMSTISAALVAGPLNLTELRKAAGTKVEVFSEAVAQLVERGHVQVSKGANNATMHALITPYHLHLDPDSPLFYPLDVDDPDVGEVTS